MNCLHRPQRAYTAAPWIIAGGLLLGASPAAAQEDTATPATGDANSGTAVSIGDSAADQPAGSGGTTTTALPRTGAGMAAGLEASWLSLGAIAGAAVAAVYAMRERGSGR